MAQAPETQRLYLGKNMLEDAKQLAELKVEIDDVLALTYQLTGNQDCFSHDITCIWLDDASIVICMCLC